MIDPAELMLDVERRKFISEKLATLVEDQQLILSDWRKPQGQVFDCEAGTNIVVCLVTTIEDLELSPGFAQIVNLGIPNTILVPALPTQGSLKLFKSSLFHSDWHLTVSPMLVDELSSFIKEQGPQTRITLIPRLSFLSPSFLERLQSLSSDMSESVMDAAGTGSMAAKEWADHNKSNAVPNLPAPTPFLRGQSKPGKSKSKNKLLQFWQKFQAKKKHSQEIKSLQQRLSDALQDSENFSTPLIDAPGTARIYIDLASRLHLTPRSSQKAEEHSWLSEAADLHALSENTLNISSTANTEFVEFTTRSTGSDSPLQTCLRTISNSSSKEPKSFPLPNRAVGTVAVEARINRTSKDGHFVSNQTSNVPPDKITADMVTCYLNRGGGGNAMIRAFASGIGCPLRYAEDETGYRPGVPVVWGVLRGSDKVVQSAKDNNQYFYYVDHAYFSRGHGKNYRVTRNGYEAGAIRDCPSDRLQKLDIELQPWNKGGSIILLCPPTDFFMEAHNCHDWFDTTLAALKASTDREIVIRRKPKPGETVEPIKDAFRRSYALVTHSSNVAIEAAIAGVPVYVSPTSAAAPVGQTDFSNIENPVYPDREAWLRHLAYNQFSMEELSDGTAWRMLQEFETRDLL